MYSRTFSMFAINLLPQMKADYITIMIHVNWPFALIDQGSLALCIDKETLLAI